MNLFYAWNIQTDEIKIFRWESSRSTFVQNDPNGDWVIITEETLRDDC